MRRYDALVIGGGPAGLAGALYLARFRRSVLLLDEGRGRAARIPRSHNVPGFPDGIAGGTLVGAMREQADRHGVGVAAGRVRELARTADGGFEAAWGRQRAAARCVLLATGASDRPPPMPYLADALRRGALRYCPVCDGYEASGRRVGVIADGEHGAQEALYLRHFSERITLFGLHGALPLAPATRRALERAGVECVEAPLASLRLWKGAVVLRHAAGQATCDTLYCALGMVVHSELAVALGARHDPGGYLLTDRHQRTTVPGLYAAGDVAKGLNQISVATGGAAIAAAAMHLALGRTDGAPAG
jgi:thioredoxin reductase (NADPH)